MVFYPLAPKRPWVAKVGMHGTVLCCGYYETPEEAAIAYCMGAVFVAGEFARG